MERPRVGSWASPVPSMPAPWGTWEMVEGPGHTPDGHGGYSPQMILTLDAKPKRISRDAIASAQPGRLQENGMVKAKFSIHAFLQHNCCL